MRTSGTQPEDTSQGRPAIPGLPKITTALLRPVPDFAPGIPSGQNTVIARLEDGSEVELFRYYTGELRFTPGQFPGLTAQEGRDLFAARDIAYLQS